MMLLDLMDKVAFGGPESSSESRRPRDGCLSPLNVNQGSKEPTLGPMPRPGNIIISVVAIVYNLSIIINNMESLASFPRLADRLLRLCGLKQFDGKPRRRCL